MKKMMSAALLLSVATLTGCSHFGTGTGSAGASGTQSGMGRDEGGIPYALGRTNPFQESGMPDATVAASREAGSLDVSQSGSMELARRSAAATIEGGRDTSPINGNQTYDLPERRSLAEFSSDQLTQGRVRLKLAETPRGTLSTRGSSNDSREPIQITVRDGIVTLRGRAESPEQRRAIESLVREVEGVKGINDQLDVASGGSLMERP